MSYWLLKYGHSGIGEDDIIHLLFNLNLKYVEFNCRCELISYESIENDGDVVDNYVLFGNDKFIPKRLHEEIYPGFECAIAPITEADARRLCFPHLEDRAEEMIEEINYDIDSPLSGKEADEYYTMIQKMYYIPGLESWASEKVRKFYKDREQLYLRKNSQEFQKAYKIFIAKCKLLGNLSEYEPYVVESDGRIVYYGNIWPVVYRSIKRSESFFSSRVEITV